MSYFQRVEVATLVVKTASRCNMDCSYCYVYHAQDTSWQTMPRTMAAQTLNRLVERVVQLHDLQQTKPLIAFHGGEPLLLGVGRLREVVCALVHRIPTISLTIQTNGTIYNDALEQLLVEYRANLSFSVSVDGFVDENDRHRLGLSGRSVYARIETTLQRSAKVGILESVLMVVDIQNDPGRTYHFMECTGAKQYNLLLRDGDHDHLPPGKAFADSANVGEWMWRLYCLYAAGPQKFRIKFFDDLAVSLLKKTRGIATPAASYALCTLTIDTDGEVKQADTFRVNGERADGLGAHGLADASLYDVANSPGNLAFLAKVGDLAEQCLGCRYLDACGGGYPSHRYKDGGYGHPSIYCSDYLHLFERMERALCS